jgi:hypothetical protein
MAFPTKDGNKKFGSRFAQRKYDSVHADKAPQGKMMDAAHEAAETPTFEAGEQEGAKEAMDQKQENNPAQVVAKHGKAIHVHTSHDHMADKHHVHSVHQDGHVHDSDHATAQDAQNTAKQLGGADVASQPTMAADSGMEMSNEAGGMGQMPPRLA